MTIDRKIVRAALVDRGYDPNSEDFGTMPPFYHGLCNAIPPSLAMWAIIIWLVASW
jgi:hypothetical protein